MNKRPRPGADFLACALLSAVAAALGCSNAAKTAVPDASLSVASLAFPATITGTSSAPATAVLTNTGQTPLTISGYTLSNTADLSVSSTCGSALASGASCQFQVVFHPQSASTVTATLTVTDNSASIPGSAQTVAITGSGMPVPAAKAALSPASLSFPSTVTNSTSSAQQVVLSNTGTATLTLSDIAIAGANAAEFVLGPAGTCGSTLAAGSSCTEQVLYRPLTASTADSATLVFTDNSGGVTGATQTATLAGTALAEVDSVTNFGDSITCGFYAQPNDGAGYIYSSQGYAGLFDTFVAAPAQDVCRQGDQAADLSRLWVPSHSNPTATGHQLYTMMIGTNDAYVCGPWSNCMSNYTRAAGAALAWLAMPASDKVLANTITQRTGGWGQDTDFGLVTSAGTGASLTFNVNQAVAGRNLYVVYHVFVADPSLAGSASISVDGVVKSTVQESVLSGFAGPTQNETWDTYFLEIVPLGSLGTHTVTFAPTSAPGAATALLWAGVPQGNYASQDGAPRVLVGAVTTSPSGNQAYNAGIYSAQIRSMVSSFVQDGMNITVVPTDTVLDPGSDFVDLLHPNNGGHAKLAAAFEKFR